MIFHNTFATPLIIFYPNHIQAWILSHFPCIFDRSYDEDYFEDLPRACTFVPLRGNQAIDSFQVFLDCILYTLHDNQPHARILDDISYTLDGWLMGHTWFITNLSSKSYYGSILPYYYLSCEMNTWVQNTCKVIIEVPIQTHPFICMEIYFLNNFWQNRMDMNEYIFKFENDNFEF